MKKPRFTTIHVNHTVLNNESYKIIKGDHNILQSGMYNKFYGDRNILLQNCKHNYVQGNNNINLGGTTNHARGDRNINFNYSVYRPNYPNEVLEEQPFMEEEYNNAFGDDDEPAFMENSYEQPFKENSYEDKYTNAFDNDSYIEDKNAFHDDSYIEDKNAFHDDSYTNDTFKDNTKLDIPEVDDTEIDINKRNKIIRISNNMKITIDTLEEVIRQQDIENDMADYISKSIETILNQRSINKKNNS
jgi:hypothetical protein